MTVRPRLVRLRRECKVYNSRNQPDYPPECNSAWHAHKYIDPAESGAILPILHANGFKIAERTVFRTMDNKEVISLFTSVARLLGLHALTVIVGAMDTKCASSKTCTTLTTNSLPLYNGQFKKSGRFKVRLDKDNPWSSHDGLSLS